MANKINKYVFGSFLIGSLFLVGGMSVSQSDSLLVTTAFADIAPTTGCNSACMGQGIDATDAGPGPGGVSADGPAGTGDASGAGSASA